MFTDFGRYTDLNSEEPGKYTVDARLVRRAANRKLQIDQNGEVQQAIARGLFERMDLLRKTPERVLVLGCGTGVELQLLRKRYPRAMIVGADLADLRLERFARARRFWQPVRQLVCFDPARNFPLADNTFDLVFGNLVLPWVFPAETFASELNRVLAPEGGFFLSTAGPDTLIELRQAWSAIDTYAHLNAMPDMHNVGDLLVGAGVADPVVDIERLAVRYKDAVAMLAEIRELGFVCAISGRRKGLHARDIGRRLGEQLQALAADQDGSVLASLEIVYAHGWKGMPKQSGSVHTFPLERLARSKQGR